MTRLQDLLRATPQPEERTAGEPQDDSLLGTLKDVGGAGLGAVASLGNFLDLPGSSVRDILAGRNLLDQWLTPLSDTNRTTGRQLLEMYGMRKNRETGMSGWLSDPGEGFRDIAGFAAEVLTDPFGPLTKGTKMAAATGRLLERAHPLVRGAAAGTKYVFDTLPEKMTKPLVNAAGSVWRGTKALFNAPSAGVSDALVQPVKEQATTATWALREEANLHAIDVVETANRAGFNLDVDDTLDMSNPDNLLSDRSPFRVNAREDQMRRYLEGIYDPTSPALQQGDFVTTPGGSQIRQVEWTNRSATGTEVKLVDDDKIYSDAELGRHWLSQAEEMPQEVMQALDRYKSQMDSIRARGQAIGMNLPELLDPHIDFAHRRKSNELRQAEQILGQSMPGWVRKNWQSLASTLMAPGGRDIVYRAFKDGTTGINALFGDNFFKSEFDRIDNLSTPSETLVDGLNSKILPGMVSSKHVDEFADSLGMTSDELWNTAMMGRPVNQSGMRAYAEAPGSYAVANSAGYRVGQVVAEGDIDNVILRAAIPPEHLTGVDDVLHDIEVDLARKGARRVSVEVTPDIADRLSQRGYQGEALRDGGSEVWSKALHEAGPAGNDAPRFVPLAEFIPRMQQMVAYQAELVRQGEVPGIQPGRGWWKSWTELRTGQDGAEKLFNMDPQKAGLVQLTPENIEAIRSVNGFPSIVEYDLARQALSEGKDVWVGRKAVRGKPGEFIMVRPTMVAQIQTRAKKLFDNLETMVKDRPLTQKEALYDTLHKTIERNYGDRVDKWMPKLDENGLVQAASPNEVMGKATLNQWQKVFSEVAEWDGSGNPAKPIRALLRMDDNSLKALMFTDDQIAAIAEKRAAAGLPQDVSIDLVDRHRALAEEIGDHVEKRYNKIYEKSAVVSGLDYMHRNGAAVTLLEKQRDLIAGLVTQRGKFPKMGSGTLSGDLQVEYDLSKATGITFNEAIQQGFLGKNVDKNKFVESVRSQLEAAGYFKADPENLKAQLNEILAVRQPADVWTELKTFNEGAQAFDLPELNTALKFSQSIMSIEKAGLLSTSLATPIRDGLSSLFNATIMGDMNPLAIAKRAMSAASFVRGMPVDPGQGIREIEEYLAARNLPSNAKTRAEAFQNFWNAHHMSGSIHPNVVTADAARMAESDSSMAILANAVGSSKKEFMEGVKRTVMKPINMVPVGGAKVPVPSALDWRVANTMTRDELGRSVMRSKGENPLVNTVNGLRGMIDGWARSIYVMDRATKTKSLAEAFAMADKVLLNADPKNFTRFEHKWMKTLFPFYSFMRQSLPLFMSELMVNPGGKLGMTIRATRLSQGGSDEYVPYQYLDSAAIPLGETDEGSLKYLTSLGLMHEDAVKYAGNILQKDIRGIQQQVMASANPALKWFIEHGTNTSLFSQGPMGGRRLDDLDPTIGRILTNLGLQDVDASGRARPVGGPLVESLASAGPLSRVLSTAKILTSPADRASNLEKALRLISGVRVENVTQEQVTRDLRDRLNAEQISLGARPMTTVIGAQKLKEYAEAKGDLETAAKLDRIEKALAVQRKLVRDREKAAKKDPRKELIDRLRELR